MYEVKGEAREFVASKREEAIEKARAYFGVDESALAIYGFPPGTVYGLAARSVIVAAPKDRAKSPAQRSRGDGPRRGEEPRARPGREAGRGRDREARGNREERGSRADRNDRGSRAEREERGPRVERDDRGSRAERDGREPRGEREEREDRGPRAGAERGQLRADERAAREPSVGTAVGELGELGRFLLGTVELMELGPFEIEESRDGDLVVLHVRGSAAEALSAGQGRTVDALQLLVNQVSARLSSEERQRVVIDVEGDADAREEFLTKLADRVAKRALQTGRPVALDPMNGRDRRMIHMALRDRDDVATMSEGEGRYRQVVVVPESSDEFEYARSQAERHRSS